MAQFFCIFTVSRIIGNRRKPIILTCVFLNLITSATLATIKEVNLSKAAATSIGIVNCGAYILVAIVTNLAGVVMDCFRDQACQTANGIIYPIIAYRSILAGCTVLAAIGTVAAFFVRETKGSYLPQS